MSDSQSCNHSGYISVSQSVSQSVRTSVTRSVCQSVMCSVGIHRTASREISSSLFVTFIQHFCLYLGERGVLSSERCHDFHKSVTEFEVDAGLSNNPKSQCLCFVRRFKGLDNETVANNKLASRFIEVTNKHGQV